MEGSLINGTTDAIPAIVRRAPQVKIIIQAVASDESNTVELYRRGVRGVVPRSISPDLLVKCVRKIAEGETWIDNQSISWVIEAYRSQATSLTDPKVQPKLSKKELAIISCITRGMRNKEIAYQIGTTEQVIKNYLRKVYDKLGVSDRLELALYCLHHELLKKYLVDAEGQMLPHTEPSQPLRAKM
jgi:DNA-binding NarL/FixJ family response regulator